MPTITRKIQILIDAPKEELKQYFDTLFGWQRITHKAANLVSTHMFLQDQAKDLIYFTDEFKAKLTNVKLDEESGVLTSSRTNTTYQVLSKNFKGEIPMALISGLNTLITSTYSKEKVAVSRGEKSLRSYRSSIPLPMVRQGITNLRKLEDGNYSFEGYNIPFKTIFGRDRSYNEDLLDRSMRSDISPEDPDYVKLCDSSIQLKKVGGKWKVFLLAVFRINAVSVASLDYEKYAICSLSYVHPIIIKNGKKEPYIIGSGQDYIHKRMAIRGALSRLQKESKYNKGGRGRGKKLQALERFEKKEANFIDAQMHLYSRMLIDYCLKYKLGKIILTNFEEAREQTSEENEESKFLLTSWSYFNLKTKIEYKASMYGISLEVE
jgi:IS605 OrfB family transposase